MDDVEESKQWCRWKYKAGIRGIQPPADIIQARSQLCLTLQTDFTVMGPRELCCSPERLSVLKPFSCHYIGGTNENTMFNVYLGTGYPSASIPKRMDTRHGIDTVVRINWQNHRHTDLTRLDPASQDDCWNRVYLRSLYANLRYKFDKGVG
jgi:hypothetical protein